jgi:hypothetical protein
MSRSYHETVSDGGVRPFSIGATRARIATG